MTGAENLDDVVAVAEDHDLVEKLSGRPICDRCLGRLFGKVSTGLDNLSRGRAIRESLGIEKGTECWLCEGLFDEIEKFSKLVDKEMEKAEFETFLIGSRIDPEVENREESLWAELNLQQFEAAKSEINREVGKILEAKPGLEVNFENPDVVAVIDTMFDHVEFNINPIFVYGRYKKSARDIPQTTWQCLSCWGKGCEKCNNTGREFATSVEEIIGTPLLEETESEGFSFHGAGREDVDVRMLGNGRPFVLQLSRPKKRTTDFEKVQSKINESKVVEVTSLQPSNRQKIIEIKGARYPKSYKAIVEFASPVQEQKLKEVVRSFHSKEVAQQTPQRVVRRRADKVRKRKILGFQASLREDKTAELLIKAEAGTYIKELVDGDEGRTKPSLAGSLGVDCRVKFLDVIEIHDEVGSDGEEL
ncbi:MAG: tRNA pseudouridine(54/55) synthase Pus10 [Methanobacteriota archaeon]|nr:MAG: tRNA pseudouridine(54/55) synthase Pus10 [Euryarchaeota archaeon]